MLCVCRKCGAVLRCDLNPCNTQRGVGVYSVPTPRSEYLLAHHKSKGGEHYLYPPFTTFAFFPFSPHFFSFVPHAPPPYFIFLLTFGACVGIVTSY
jgi:hypothetical protein